MAGARKPGRNFLFVPGPTNVPDRILRAMHIAMEDHRSSDFPKLTLPLFEDLKKIFKTREGQVVVYPSSGTGAWEAALTNTRSPGDKLLAARFGQFSSLWIELARRHGLEVIVQEMKDAKCRRAYFEFGDHVKSNSTGYFPYTPALPLLHGLRESLAMLEEEGLENVSVRHRHLANGTRAAVEAWDLKLCAKEPKWHSDTVSAIMVPRGVNGAEVIDRAYRRYNLALGVGLSQMAGKLFRIGHLGDLNELMLLGAISGAEMAMNDIGIEVELGSGVAAAQAEFRGAAIAREQQKVAAE